MNDQRLADTLAKAGFKGDALRTAFGIAKRESGGRPDAYNPDVSTGDQSYGLFQINMLGSMGPARRQQFGLKRNEDLLDPLKNARAAYRMSRGGKDFGAWGIGPNAYRSGAGLETIAPYMGRVPKPSGRGAPRVESRSARPASRGAATRTTTPSPETTYSLKGGVDATALANAILGGTDITEALQQATTPYEMVAKTPRLPMPVAQAHAAKFGGTIVDAGGEPGPTDAVSRAIAIAKQQIGKPYVFGATNPKVGFDCSGLIDYAFTAAGIATPGRLTTGPMARMGKKVPWKSIQPGDWVVRDSGGSGHVVMYVGAGQVIAAPHTGEVVQYQPLDKFSTDSRFHVRRWHG